MSKQFFLDLDFTPPEVHEHEISAHSELRLVDLRRAVLGWMALQAPAGLAIKTPTRLTSYLADVAGFWNVPKHFRQLPGPEQLHVPCHTMIVECRSRRQDCWPDFTKSSELLPVLRELKKERLALEAQIRAEEPHLRESASLFEEYAEWHYDRTTNRDYHRVSREIDRINKALYKGTRFESIRSAHLADYLYLAVPAKAVHPHELADGWGLLWINSDMQAQMVVRAECEHCPAENHFHLVQNIASAAMRDTLFANGLYIRGGHCRFLPKPHRRRPRPSHS